MKPKLFEFPAPKFLQGIVGEHMTIYSYGVFIALGVLLGFFIALKKSRKHGMNSDKLANLFLWGIAAAYVGGKLFYFLENPMKYINDPSEILRSGSGGFVFYGSLLFVIPTLIWRLKKDKIPMRPFFDVLAFVGPVVHSIGRIGCLMAGCCHGRVCDLPIGITFSDPETHAEPMDMPLYPTQLFDIGVNLIILITVFLIERKKKFDGQLFLIYLVMYAIGRSIVEMYRGDEARGYVFNGLLSHSQFIAILVFLATVWVWRRWSASDQEL